MNGIPAATVERGDMLRVAWRGIGAVLVVLAIASCAVLAPAAPTRAPLDIVVGDQLLRAETSTAPGQPALDQSRAISLATADVPTAAAATGISARFVSLTVRDGDGAVALGIVARPVWLVTFVGATYDPASALESTCPCGDAYKRATTAVALDPRSGSVVVVYGVN